MAWRDGARWVDICTEELCSSHERMCVWTASRNVLTRQIQKSDKDFAQATRKETQSIQQINNKGIEPIMRPSHQLAVQLIWALNLGLLSIETARLCKKYDQFHVPKGYYMSLATETSCYTRNSWCLNCFPKKVQTDPWMGWLGQHILTIKIWPGWAVNLSADLKG